MRLILTSAWPAKCSRTEEYFVSNLVQVLNNGLSLTRLYRWYIRIIGSIIANAIGGGVSQAQCNTDAQWLCTDRATHHWRWPVHASVEHEFWSQLSSWDDQRSICVFHRTHTIRGAVTVWRLNCGKFFVARDRKKLRRTFLFGSLCCIICKMVQEIHNTGYLTVWGNRELALETLLLAQRLFPG